MSLYSHIKFAAFFSMYILYANKRVQILHAYLKVIQLHEAENTFKYDLEGLWIETE